MEISEAKQRCWAEIDLDALCGNYRTARALAGRAAVICVLKGNAYGLGALPVARALSAEGAGFFAVADGDEAEELLKALPGARVLVLGAVGEIQAARLIRLGAGFTLFSPEQGAALRAAAAAAGMPARVHLKLDTGLHRLGFEESGMEEAFRLLTEGSLLPEGIFTHLALHDPGSDGEQIGRLLGMRRALEERGVRFPMCHALDSIGLTRYPDWRFDAVRTGAWLYGVEPARNPHRGLCRPTVVFRTRVTQVRSVAAGERVGYDDEHRLARDTVLATLSCGYLDGVPRWNNEGFVEIRGRRAPVAGLVCMDQMMADVTDIPGVRPGDEVTLLGGGISVEEYAAWGRLNRNEALGRLGRRVTRIYARGGRTEIVNEYQEENGER